MKPIGVVALALLLLSIEAVVVRYLGLSMSRIDVTVAIIAFLALRAGALEGAFSSFAVGYLFDVMSGRPTGLYVFLGVFLFLVARVAGSRVDVRSGISFALFAMGCDAAHRLLAALLSSMVSRGEGEVALSGLFTQILLTGAAALLLYPLLKRLDSGSDRPHAGLLL